MRIALDEKKNRKKIISSLILVLLQYLVAFILLSQSFTEGNSESEYQIYFLCITFVASIGLLQFFHHISIRKRKECVISYEDSVFNDYSVWMGKVKNLKLEDMESISRWSKNKKINQYKIIMGENYRNQNQLKRLFNPKTVYIKDNVVNSEALLKMAEMIGNDIAKRKS